MLSKSDRVPERLADLHLYVVLFDVRHRRGGLTRNALHKAMLVAERLGRRVTVLTLDFDDDIDFSIRYFRKIGLIDDRILIKNIFEDAGLYGVPATAFFSAGAQADPVPLRPCPRDHTDPHPGPDMLPVESRDVDDHLVLTYVDPSGRPVRSEQHDRGGAVRRIACLDPLTGAAVHRRYYDPAGRMRAEAVVADSGSRAVRFAFYDEAGTLVRTAESQLALNTAWLDSYAAMNDESIFQVETETALFTRAMLDMKATGVAKVTMMHSGHLAHPHTFGSPTMPQHAWMLDQLNRFDAFVVITEAQRKDIEAEFGPRQNLFAVPHDAPKSRDDVSPTKDPLMGVGIGRLVDQKNWDHVIRAFGEVVREVPAARFALWGSGPQRDDYEELIADLGIGTNFLLPGVTEDASSVFAEAAYSVAAGIREGFGLVLLESMAAGTPVIAYDGKYGAIDIIRNGVDGTLVPYGDEGALAGAMLGMLRNPARTLEMGRAALEIDERFSSERCVDGWLGVYCAALAQRDHRIMLPELAAYATSVSYGRRRCTIAGSLSAPGLPELPSVALYVRPRASVAKATYLEIADFDWDGSGGRFSARFDPSFISRDEAPWDAYLSVSLRNAHRFVRLSVEPEGISSRGGRMEPYPTVAGNVSWRPSPSLADRLRRLRARVLKAAG